IHISSQRGWKIDGNKEENFRAIAPFSVVSIEFQVVPDFMSGFGLKNGTICKMPAFLLYWLWEQQKNKEIKIGIKSAVYIAAFFVFAAGVGSEGIISEVAGYIIKEKGEDFVKAYVQEWIAQLVLYYPKKIILGDDAVEGKTFWNFAFSESVHGSCFRNAFASLFGSSTSSWAQKQFANVSSCLVANEFSESEEFFVKPHKKFLKKVAYCYFNSKILVSNSWKAGIKDQLIKDIALLSAEKSIEYTDIDSIIEKNVELLLKNFSDEQ
ncbi:MAG: hypothetical protein IJ150_10595, partial [Bacteroidales bacterium]|nr:hypothetical protein [Bacteroidales bacterium]